MATVALTKETFEETVLQDGIVFVDWWAEWCGPCRAFAPVFERASEEHEDIVFGKIDTEAEPELSMAAQIRSIPTLMAFRDGVLVFAQPGALPAAIFAQLVQAVRDLDMDEVRAKMAAEQEAREGAAPAGNAATAEKTAATGNAAARADEAAPANEAAAGERAEATKEAAEEATA
ncbi:MAG: thioredoxin [Hamadaea sp.]|nr:thioredoxin [Hamadaea sp.]